jgi:hypothetical protein
MNEDASAPANDNQMSVTLRVIIFYAYRQLNNANIAQLLSNLDATALRFALDECIISNWSPWTLCDILGK